jgi:hypothetical protein
MNINFLCSLPRAGNTLLGSIINENKKIKLSPNSITLDIVYKLHELKNDDIFKNFPKHSSLDNLIKSSLQNYYKDWNCDLIIDRGPWGTPDNLYILKKIINNPKFLILLRPLEECLASFAKIQIDNKNYTKNNINNYLLRLLRQDEVIGKNIWSINNLIKENENYKIFYYDDLINNTDYFLQNLSLFLGFDIKKPKKLKQFSIDQIYYKDNYIDNLHKIRTDKIEKLNYVVEDYLNYDMIQFIKYNNPISLKKLNETNNN